MVVALPFEVKVTEVGFWLGPPAISKATIVFNLKVEPTPRFTWLETKDPRNDSARVAADPFGAMIGATRPEVSR